MSLVFVIAFILFLCGRIPFEPETEIYVTWALFSIADALWIGVVLKWIQLF